MYSKEYADQKRRRTTRTAHIKQIQIMTTHHVFVVLECLAVFERTSQFGDVRWRISWFLLFCASRAPSAAATCAVPRHRDKAWQGDRRKYVRKDRKRCKKMKRISQKLFEQLTSVSWGSQYSEHLFQIIHGTHKLLTRSCLLRQCFKLITTRSELSLNLAGLWTTFRTRLGLNQVNRSKESVNRVAF